MIYLIPLLLLKPNNFYSMSFRINHNQFLLHRLINPQNNHGPGGGARTANNGTKRIASQQRLVGSSRQKPSHQLTGGGEEYHYGGDVAAFVKYSTPLLRLIQSANGEGVE